MHKDLFSLQNQYINHLIASKEPVRVYLKNSVCLKGRLVKYNDYAIFLQDTGTQMILKNLISTVAPQLHSNNH